MNPLIFYPHFAGRMNLNYSRPDEQELERRYDLNGTISPTMMSQSQQSSQSLSQEDRSDLGESFYDMQVSFAQTQVDQETEKLNKFSFEDEDSDQEESQNDRLNILDKTITD